MPQMKLLKVCLRDRTSSIPGLYAAGEAARGMLGLRSGGRMRVTKFTSGGEVVPTSLAFVEKN